MISHFQDSKLLFTRRCCFFEVEFSLTCYLHFQSPTPRRKEAFQCYKKYNKSESKLPIGKSHHFVFDENLLMTFNTSSKMKANPFCLKLKQTSKKRYFNYFQRVFQTSQFINLVGQGGRKNGLFTVRQTIRGRGGQPPRS